MAIVTKTARAVRRALEELCERWDLLFDEIDGVNVNLELTPRTTEGKQALLLYEQTMEFVQVAGTACSGVVFYIWLEFPLTEDSRRTLDEALKKAGFTGDVLNEEGKLEVGVDNYFTLDEAVTFLDAVEDIPGIKFTPAVYSP